MNCRGRRVPRLVAAAGATVLLAAGAVVSRTRVDDGPLSSARVVEAAPALHDVPAPASVELEAQRTELDCAELSDAAAADDAVDAPVDVERVGRVVDRSVAALAKSLEGAEWNRTNWDAAIGATAGCLPDGALARLREVFHDATRPVAERLVAAELVRKLGHGSDTLTDSGTVDDLRRLALGTVVDDPASHANVAARTLAWLGDDVDRARLLDRVCGSTSETERSVSTWALAAAPADRLLPALCARLSPELDARAAELALVTFDVVLRRPPEAGAGELSGADVRAGDAALEALLLDARTSVRVRQRALVACAALAERSDASRAAALLAACVDDRAAPSDLRLRAAESLYRIGTNCRVSERKSALDHLIAVARDVDGAPAADRRRAWSALTGALDRATPDDALAADTVAQLPALADAETDASVREVVATSTPRAR